VDERIDEEKTRVRAAARAAMAGMSASDRAAASARVRERLGALLPEEGVVLFYLADGGEPDLDPLLGAWIASGWAAAPRCDWEAGTFEPVRVASPADLEVRRFGVREPRAGKGSGGVVGVDELAAALVPGVAFDAGGRRLGRGGGFYDRFLAGLPAGARRVGVCFARQVVDRVPAAAHDERVGAVVTEDRVISVDRGSG